MEDLIETIDELRGRKVSLDIDVNRATIAEINATIAETEQAIADLKISPRATLEQGGRSGGRTVENPKVLQEIADLEEKILGLEQRRNAAVEGFIVNRDAEIAAAEDLAEIARREAANAAAGVRSASEVALEEKRQAAIKKIIDRLKEERAALDETTEALNRRRLAALQASPEQQDEARRLVVGTQLIRTHNAALATRKQIQDEINQQRAESNKLFREEEQRLAAFELDRIKDDAKELAETLSGGLIDAIRGVENAFASMIDNILEQMARLAIQRTLIDPLLGFVNAALDGDKIISTAIDVGAPTFTGEKGNKFPGSNPVEGPTIDVPELGIVSGGGQGSTVVNIELTQNISSQFLDGAGAEEATERIADRAAERSVEMIENSQAFRQSVRG